MPTQRRQAGVGLIEVLIAVLVLAIGLLGLARLEVANLRTSHGAQSRSQAVSLAYDILDRMRVNRVAALAGNYTIALGAAAPTGTTPAAIDLQAWKANLAAGLASGDGAVASTVTGGVTQFTVTVQWDDSRGQAAALQFTVNTEL